MFKHNDHAPGALTIGWAAAILLCSAFLAGCGGEAAADAIDEDPAALFADLSARQKRHDPLRFVEVDLGEYFVTLPPNEEVGSLFVRFHIYGVVDESADSSTTP